MIDEKLFHELAEQVENEWQMTGFVGTVYEEFALEVAKKYIDVKETIEDK